MLEHMEDTKETLQNYTYPVRYEQLHSKKCQQIITAAFLYHSDWTLIERHAVVYHYFSFVLHLRLLG